MWWYHQVKHGDRVGEWHNRGVILERKEGWYYKWLTSDIVIKLARPYVVMHITHASPYSCEMWHFCGSTPMQCRRFGEHIVSFNFGIYYFYFVSWDLCSRFLASHFQFATFRDFLFLRSPNLAFLHSPFRISSLSFHVPSSWFPVPMFFVPRSFVPCPLLPCSLFWRYVFLSPPCLLAMVN